MMVRRLLLAALAGVALAGSLAGCTVNTGYFTPTESVDAAKLAAPAAKAIAADMTARVAEQIGPPASSIALRQDASPFGTAFEEGLRGHGYTIASEQKPGASRLPVAYRIADVNGSILVRVSLPTAELTRTYTISASGASPAGPLSVMPSTKGEG